MARMNHVTVHPSRAMHDAECDITRGHTKDDAIEHHYRVTRPGVYTSVNCPGHRDVSARQGYYVDACCATHAARNIQARMLDRVSGIVGEALDVQVWR
jgi:hypothetical protein